MCDLKIWTFIFYQINQLNYLKQGININAWKMTFKIFSISSSMTFSMPLKEGIILEGLYYFHEI